MSKGTLSILLSVAVLAVGSVLLALEYALLGSALLYIGGSAVIGAVTNRIAIHAIFSPWPSQRLALPGTGLVERNHEQIIEAIADAVAGDLITPETLSEWLEQADFFENLRDQAAMQVRGISSDPEAREVWSDHLRQALRLRLGQVMESSTVYRAIRKFFAEKAGIVGKIGHATGLGDYDSVTYRIVDSIRDRLDEWMAEGNSWVDEQFAEALEEAALKLEGWNIRDSKKLGEWTRLVVAELNVRQIVSHSLAKFEPAEVRKLVQEFSGEHLSLLEVWGAVLGATAGGVIWAVSQALGLM